MNQLEIQFHGSSPQGPFTIRKPFSVMTAYYIPRDNIKSAKGMKGVGRYGIYCLFGGNRIYIGQTRNGIERIMEHTRGKQFWSEAVLFLADPIHFNLNIISGLERHAIEQALEGSPYTVENKSVPQYETSSDFEKEQIRTIYEEISFIMGFVGIRTRKDGKAPQEAAEPVPAEPSPPVVVEPVNAPVPGPADPVFHTTCRGVKALMSVIGGAYVVRAGSVVDLDTPLHASCLAGMKTRQDALGRGMLAKRKDGSCVLMQDIAFSSPSAAAEFVLGGKQNGRHAWVDADGRRLRDYLTSPHTVKLGG